MLTDLSVPQLWLAALLGVFIDRLFGEPARFHPLIGFGHIAAWLERRCNRARAGRFAGICAWALAVLPLVLLAQAVLAAAHYLSAYLSGYLPGYLRGYASDALAITGHALLLYFCIGLRSLHDHNLPIQQALESGDLAQARLLTARIVTRDTGHGDAAYLSKASVESVLENGCDAVFGTLFWFAVGGGAAALLYRLANTLDAMWGYRSERFLHFGWAAARIDDVLNWIPARLTALTYALLGNTRLAWHCWQTQAPAWPSPNAGPVMSAGAGALELALGRSARYDGIDETRPPLGEGRAAQAGDIGRAWRLVWRSACLWLLLWSALTAFYFASGVQHA